MSGKSRVAWLIYGTWKAERTVKKGWLEKQPPGVIVIDEILRDAGIVPATCSPASASQYDVVLVSFTSIYDIAQYCSVAFKAGWDTGRDFKVVAGGFGMQTPYPVRHVVDYAAFGRAESYVVEMVNAALLGVPCDHESVMNLPDIYECQAAQPVTLFDGMMFQEQFTGCPLACKFCHYTFARKHLGTDHAYQGVGTEDTGGSYVQQDYVREGGHTGTVSPLSGAEVTWPQLVRWPEGKPIPGTVTVGLDGCSERIRWLYGKRISADEFVEGLTVFPQRAAEEGKVAAIVLRLYDISFPAEDPTDRAELKRLINEVPPPPLPVNLVVHVTPFRPTPWTPMQWEPFQTRSVNKLVNYQIRQPKKDDFYAKYGQFIEAPASGLEEAVVSRHDGSEVAAKALRMITSHRWAGLKSAPKMRAFKDRFPEYSDYLLGAHDIDTTLPSAVIRGKADLDSLRLIARQMRVEEAKSLEDRQHRRGRRSIMGRTVIPVAAA